MDLRDLVYFETIARLGNLGRAADELGRTKPALSKCIRRLEEQLKVPLFERSGRRIVLTQPGVTLLAHAARMRASMADAMRHVSEQADGQHVHIRLGLGTLIAETLLLPVAKWLGGEPAGISLELRVGLNDTLQRDLADDKLDGIVTTAQAGDSSVFAGEDWLADDMVVVARSGHPLDRGGVVEMVDMAGYQWALTGPSVASRQWLDRTFSHHGLPPPAVRVEAGSSQLVPTFILSGDLLGFLPRRNLRAWNGGLVELANDATTLHRRLAFFYRKHGYAPRALHRLAETLRRHVVEP